MALIQCTICSAWIAPGRPCGNCAKSTTKADAQVVEYQAVEAVATDRIIDTPMDQPPSTNLARIAFVVILAFILILTVGGNSSLGKAIMGQAQALGGEDLKDLTPTVTPTLSASDLPKGVKYIVTDCYVEGEEAGKVNCFKTEMRKVEGKGWLAQFQRDDGSFIQEEFPTFDGHEFLLVCIPKELGPDWAKVYGEKFFSAIGTRPIDQVTAKPNDQTIKDGSWLFARPGSQPPPGGGGPTKTPFLPITHTPYPTETLAPTLPPATSTPEVIPENVVNNFEVVSFEDLYANSGTGADVWNGCNGASLTFRSTGSSIEAACPSFDQPTVYIKWVTGLGESYTLYEKGGGGTWFVRGGVMSLGYTETTYSWTNSLGIKYYSTGLGKVTLSPVQLFAPTETPAPTTAPGIEVTPTSWDAPVGCVQLSWETVKSSAEAIVNEQGDSVLIRRADGKWWGNNNPDRCYEISGLPTTVINMDNGKSGVWNLKTGSAINLARLDASYQGNSFFWRISNYVWVGMIDPQ